VQTRAELIKLHRRLGITTIYVTHDQVEAMTMGDRIAVMNEGLVQQVDAPLTLYNQPANMFVAGFIGSPSMNFVPSRIVADGEGLMIDAGSFKVQAPPSRVDTLKPYAGKEIVFGIRPEDIFDRAVSMVPAQPGNTIKALVEVTEPMGDRIHLYLAAGPHSLIANVDAESKLQEEREAEFVLDLEKTHAFDKGTEKAIY
jgi:multiple sugar transport system ATP-binding protein